MIYTGIADISGLSMAENYIFTKDAFQEYINHLEEDGKLIFMFHQYEDLTRGILTAVEVLMENGISQSTAFKHIAIINNSMSHGNGNDDIFMPVFIFKESPFSQEEAEEIAKTSFVLGFKPIFLPSVFEEDSIYASLASGETTYRNFIKYNIYNIKPTTDNSPFFYNFEKGIPENLLILFII